MPIPREDSLRDRYDRILLKPMEDFDDYDEDEVDDGDFCHHGVGFGEDCEECEEEEEIDEAENREQDLGL